MQSGVPDVDRIVIPGMPLRARVGVTEEERRAPQEIVVGVVLHLDLAEAGAADDISRTVDYESVCDTVSSVLAERPRHLVEALAEDVAAAVLAGFSVSRVDVRVEKPGALRSRGVPYAAVEISRGHRG